MPYQDRAHAGRVVGKELSGLQLTDPLVLGLPRGGVPVAAEVAAALHAPLEVFVARKVGAPGHEEFGIGAVAEGGTRVADRWTLERLRISDDEFARLAVREEARVVALVERYRPGRALPPLAGRDIVLVDDGLATGVTAEAALTALRGLGPRQLILAEPVCARDTARRLESVADRVLCAFEPDQFHAVGAWYQDFDATTDQEILDILHSSSTR